MKFFKDKWAWLLTFNKLPKCTINLKYLDLDTREIELEAKGYFIKISGRCDLTVNINELDNYYEETK